MMPVPASQNNHQESVNYKKKYKALKKKLHLLVYEQECFIEELRKSQRRLLKLSRDRSFLLDRLLQYEKVEDTSSDSEGTASSDSEAEAGKEGGSAKKRKSFPGSQMGSTSGSSLLDGAEYQSPLAAHSLTLLGQATGTSSKIGEPPKKRAKVTKKAAKQAQSKFGASAQPGQPASPPAVGLIQPPPGHMTREELERHLDLKQSSKPQFMGFENAPHSLPDDIFSHDNSNPDG